MDTIPGEEREDQRVCDWIEVCFSGGYLGRREVVFEVGGLGVTRVDT